LGELYVNLISISEKIAAAGQPTAASFQRLAAEGFSTIINNRPDDEERSQPGTKREHAAAEGAGLGYSWAPPITLA
jgi:uncharacterized protein (TIGR01244 family)